jgi:hypothetical protein
MKRADFMKLTDLSEDQIKTRTKLGQMPFLATTEGQHSYTPFEAFLVRLSYEITRKGHNLKDASKHVSAASHKLAAAWSKIETSADDFLYLDARANPDRASFAGDCLLGIMRVFDVEGGYAGGSLAHCYFVGTAAEIFSNAQKAILAIYTNRKVTLGELRLESLIVVNATTAWRFVKAQAWQINKDRVSNEAELELANVFGEAPL